MVTESTDVPFRARFDHATSPELVGDSALHDHELFSSRSVQYLGDSTQRLLPGELDPPEDAKYRRLLNAPLSPHAVRAREAQIRTLCVALIDEIAPRWGSTPTSARPSPLDGKRRRTT